MQDTSLQMGQLGPTDNTFGLVNQIVTCSSAEAYQTGHAAHSAVFTKSYCACWYAARRRRFGNRPGPLKGMRFHLCGSPDQTKVFEAIIQHAGGTLIPNVPSASTAGEQSHVVPGSSTLTTIRTA